MTHSYTYDDAGNRLTHIGNPQGGFFKFREIGYTYDRLHRVTKADYTVPSSVSTVFEYDLLGNRNTVYDTLNDVTYSYAHNEANEYTDVSVGLTAQDEYLYDERCAPLARMIFLRVLRLGCGPQKGGPP